MNTHLLLCKYQQPKWWRKEGGVSSGRKSGVFPNQGGNGILQSNHWPQRRLQKVFTNLIVIQYQFKENVHTYWSGSKHTDKGMHWYEEGEEEEVGIHWNENVTRRYNS